MRATGIRACGFRSRDDPEGTRSAVAAAASGPPAAQYTGRYALLAQSVEHLHGKEGVDGSSPSEGFDKMPANGILLSSIRTTRGVRGGYIPGTRGAW